MNNNDSLVARILGIYSDLQTQTKLCSLCISKAKYSSEPRTYTLTRNPTKALLLCKEHAEESGIDMDDEE